MKIQRNYIILTGGPGSGKTTIINALARKGYKCIAETGRKIIQEEVLNGGLATPWDNPKAYADKMLHYAIKDYTTMQNETSLIFFDRGIPDVLGYVNLVKIEQTPALLEAIKEFRYNPVVYILPPWEEIYQTDTERKQDFEEAIATYKEMLKVYHNNEYTVVEVPYISVDERVQFILEDITTRLSTKQK